MADLLFLTDSYKKSVTSKILSITTKGDLTEITLESTVFYPQGGGQPSDKGTISNTNGTVTVSHCKMNQGNVVHQGKLSGKLEVGDEVEAVIDWSQRYHHMRWHTAGHIVHEAVMQIVPLLKPLKADHSKNGWIEYDGAINEQLRERVEKEANFIVAQELPITTEFVDYETLKQKAAYVPESLPQNKPLRIVQIGDFSPIPDGGTQLLNTNETGKIVIDSIENNDEHVKVYYHVEDENEQRVEKNTTQQPHSDHQTSISIDHFRNSLLTLQNTILEEIAQRPQQKDELFIKYFGTHGLATSLIKKLKDLPQADKKTGGMLVNQFKSTTQETFADTSSDAVDEWFDVSLPGEQPPFGSLHIVTQAIAEITNIFKQIGFTRVRHPEVDWDWYPFESLNMPANHPARDEWETFFIEYPGKPGSDPKKQKIVLTPHTSNGQVREMEKGKLPIRMINIAKCYRRQSDVSHVPMFHQFEGLYVDKDVSIAHLKGVLDYFVKCFFGESRTARIRPYHFQFTEPSFEVDISCAVCGGTGKIANDQKCKICKQGWLELGGAGMVHPVVLQNGGIDPNEWSGFAFGWGIERTYMMKSGTKLDDIRLLYSNDVRFLEQF